MGRYTGPKARINRRLGIQVYESNGAVKATQRKETPPGMHKRRKKPTNYGIGLTEKQKIKFYFGLRDRQLLRYYNIARRAQGNTGQNLLVLCERRLDNVVRRAGFAATRPQARQGIVHRHFQLNGRTVNKPGIMVKAGDIITVRNRPNLQKVYKMIQETVTVVDTDWINFDREALTAVVTALPTFDDVSLAVDINHVVAFLSR